MKTIPIRSAFALSELETRAEDLDPDLSVGYAALLAYDGGSIFVRDFTHAQEVAADLIELSNLCDEYSRMPELTPSERRANRYACQGLSTLALAVARSFPVT